MNRNIPVSLIQEQAAILVIVASSVRELDSKVKLLEQGFT